MAISLEVWGDYACFSRPEMKVERVSYDVMTPSAARGLLEAIMWHPGMRWVIDRIHVCNPIRFTNVRRNEVKDIVSKPIISVLSTGKSPSEMYIATSKSIQQRASMVLKDVRYVIDAHFDMTDQASDTDSAAKFYEMAQRRMEKGQCYYQPYFGMREFSVCFKPCVDRPVCPDSLKGERDLGWMLLDMDFHDESNIRPLFFRAVMHDGVIEVPSIYSAEVRR